MRRRGIKPHQSKRAQPNHQRLLAHGIPDRQATLGGRRQETIDKWKEGTAALEATMVEKRKSKHAFVPMGRLPACKVCGSDRDETYQGTRIHYKGDQS